jgi:hypothetical protein
MALDFPNLIPPNNLRLPDALTVRQGSGPLIGRLVLEGDIAARAAGIHLRLRHDFDGLVDFSKSEAAAKRWYPVIDQFNPARSDISPENGFWLAGENDDGEIVTVSAARVFDWHDTNLEEQAVAVFYGRNGDHPCTITPAAAPIARQISGLVYFAAAAWIRPDYRKRDLSQLMQRMAKAYALSRWPLDWAVGFVPRALADNGTATGYGVKHLAYSFFYPELRWSELVLAYTTSDEVYDDFAIFLDAELSDPGSSKFAPRSLGSILTHEVTSVSPDVVRQGSSNRS